MKEININTCLHSFVIPYHSNKELLLKSLELLIKTLPNKIKKEIIIVANNSNETELHIEIPYEDCIVIPIAEDLLYAKAVNLGVSHSKGDVVTLCDEDLFYLSNWYEPLFNKFISSEKIGSVGCKLLNPSDNSILDFGIDFALYNSVHPTRGLPWNHPYAMFDRKVQAFCSAILMTTPELFKKVGGMDSCMAYLCCDTDYGIKIKKAGYENWVVSSSMVYHKGISTKNNVKNTRYSYLASDARAMFFAKDYNDLDIDMTKWLETTFSIFKINHKIFKRYILVNLSSYTSSEWFVSVIKKTLNIDYICEYKYNPYERQPERIQLYDYISLNLIDCISPIIYFVDEVKCLKYNAIWKNLRHTDDDIVIDINGSIINFNDLEHMYSECLQATIK